MGSQLDQNLRNHSWDAHPEPKITCRDSEEETCVFAVSVHCVLSRNMWQRNCFSSQATEQSVTLGRSFIFTTDLAQHPATEQIETLDMSKGRHFIVNNSETGHRSDPDFGTEKWLKQYRGDMQGLMDGGRECHNTGKLVEILNGWWGWFSWVVFV